MFEYRIDIGTKTYIAALNDSGAKVVWEMEEDSVIFRKRLDGKFSFNRTKNEPLFDRIMDFSFCDKGTLYVSNKGGELIQGFFMKKDLTISEEKCLIEIKFEKQDEYTCLDGIAEKEFNILATYKSKPILPIVNMQFFNGSKFEFHSYYGTTWAYTSFDSTIGWIGLLDENNKPYDTALHDGNLSNLYENRYTLYSGWEYIPGGNNKFDIQSTYAYEIKIIPQLGGIIGTPPLGWDYNSSITINDVVYDKFIRNATLLNGGQFTPQLLPPPIPIWASFSVFSKLNSGTEIIYTRGRRLNDVITSLLSQSNCFTEFKSDFFTSNVNPISGENLTNIIISQKSDCKNPSSSDPATRGIITFKGLMNSLQEMFNVRWGIDGDGNFRIEHKKYWDNNCSYKNLLTISSGHIINTNFEGSIIIRIGNADIEFYNPGAGNVQEELYNAIIDDGSYITLNPLGEIKLSFDGTYIWFTRDSKYVNEITILPNEFNATWEVVSQPVIINDDTNIGINLIIENPNCLLGTNEYSFESNLPIRETFKMMESWNIDFVGTDIEYSDCIITGETISHDVSLFTSDIDPTFFIDSSDEGFCMFHCSPLLESYTQWIGEVPSMINAYPVIGTNGGITKTFIRNGHLSWANLQESYWKYDRYFPVGEMNGIKNVEFEVRPLKYQKEISFPYCFQDFNPQKLVKTKLGDGIVKSAEWSFKTSWLTVKLMYKDNN